MDPRSTAKLIAACIGAFLVLESVLSAQGALTRSQDSEIHLFWFVGPGILIALALAYFIWRYASKLAWPEGDSNEAALLRVGVKLLGVYLLAIGAPSLIAVVAMTGLMSFADVDMSNYQVVGVKSLFEMIVGIILIKWSDRITRTLMRDA